MDKEEVLRYAALFEGLDRQVDECKEDMCNAIGRGRVSLDEQVRAYDLLNRLLEAGSESLEYADTSLGTSLYGFRQAYENAGDAVAVIADVPALMKEAESLMVPLQDELNEMRFAAASAASLHEFAKDVFEIWKTSGIFARRRALNELRERAGFRLESHRIGNYVAKTFDLMNEAQARFARAQQALFAADVRYKIKQDTYGQIKDMIPSRLCLDPDAALEGKMRLCGLKYIKCVKEPVALDWPLDKREIII